MKQVILCDIRSHYNVGAIFRTCDAAGVAKVWLAGVTPAPKDRFGRAVPEIHKTALGAEETIPSESVTDVIATVAKLQAAGSVVVAVELAPGSISLTDFVVPDNVVYVLGSETEGLPAEVLEVVDHVVEIPMLGAKESLNVSVACGIVLYH
jgi:23S rRNA (guanosine2251-2'-O)-methyltransferase